MKLPPILVLAGGMGTRVRHISGNLPKILIPINGVPFLEIQLNLLAKSGLGHVIYSVGFKEEVIRAHLDPKKWPKLNLDFVSDGPNSLGTGGAIRNALDKLGQEFFVTYGDSYLEINYKEFYEFSKNYDSVLSIYKNYNQLEKSNVKKRKFNLISYDKFTNNSKFKYVDFGLMYFKSDIFREFAPSAAFDLANLLKILSKRNQLWGFETKRRFYEIGSEKGIVDLQSHLKGRD